MLTDGVLQGNRRCGQIKSIMATECSLTQFLRNWIRPMAMVSLSIECDKLLYMIGDSLASVDTNVHHIKLLIVVIAELCDCSHMIITL